MVDIFLLPCMLNILCNRRKIRRKRRRMERRRSMRANMSRQKCLWRN